MNDTLRLAIRLAVAAALLFLAFRLAIPADERSVFEALARRFQVLLGAAGLAAPLAPLLRAYVVANFLALVLPSALLSDVYRVVDARRDTGRSRSRQCL